LLGLGWWIDDVSFTRLLQAATCQDNAPIAGDDTASTTTGSPVTVNVLGNDGDPDGDAISVTAVTDPPHGTAANNGDGTVTYTPDAAFSGSDGFDYTISDGRGGTDTAHVSITVTPAGNRPPNAVDDTATTVEDQPKTIAVLTNDTDPDGDTLLVSAASDAAHGSADINADGTITYTPDAGFVGSDSFTYTVSDGRGGSDTATVSMTVTQAPNRKPTAVNDTTSTLRDTPVRINVLANDTDPDGDALSVSNVTDPPHGAAVDNHDGTITYTPDAGYTGSDTFQYTIGDGHGGSDTATVTISVAAPSDTAKVTGGGWFNQAGSRNQFSLNGQVKNAIGKGKLSFDQDGGISLTGTIEAIRIAGSSADVNGSCTIAKGGKCTFQVHVVDNAEPGTGFDTFSIKVFDANGTLTYQATGTLAGGNIQIR